MAFMYEYIAIYLSVVLLMRVWVIMKDAAVHTHVDMSRDTHICEVFFEVELLEIFNCVR